MKNVILITGLCFFSIFFSCKNSNPVNSPAPLKTELEGSWAGTNMDGIDQTQWTYVIKLDTISIQADSIEKYHGIFTLDTASAPKQITIRITKGTAASDEGKSIPALYNLSGNILIITANAPGSARPSSMDSAPELKLTNSM